MAHTHHHHRRERAVRGLEPSSYRRQHSRLHRARCKHMIRIGRYDVLPLLRRKFGYYW